MRLDAFVNASQSQWMCSQSWTLPSVINSSCFERGKENCSFQLDSKHFTHVSKSWDGGHLWMFPSLCEYPQVSAIDVILHSI